jgi:hypothetical protein
MKFMNIEPKWKSIAVHDDKLIHGFFGDYRFLSNFHPCHITWNGHAYCSTEAAFQAAKCLSLDDQKNFQSLNPSEAKKLGQKIEMREDWEEVKVDIMFLLNYQKFEKYYDLRQKL